LTVGKTQKMLQNDTQVDEEELFLRKILMKRKQIYELELQKVHYERELSRKSIGSSSDQQAFDEVSPYLQYPPSVLQLLLKQEKEKKNMEDDENTQTRTDESENRIAMLTEHSIPKHCVPIRTDVRNMDWKALGSITQFNVILMDPPWQLATSNPIRGVTISYKPLSDKHIQSMDINALQEKDGGFLFIWVINAKYIKTLDMIEKWGYTYVDEITWVKRTIHRRLAKGHGYYLQHAKENCIIAVKGQSESHQQEILKSARERVANLSDVIFSDRRGQSQKPEDIYHFIEQMVPNGNYLEIFGRRNNLRDYWVTIGNEL